uniref:SUMF1/EgtB/PvdO family nonheme iron enzyme n=1 Tax=Blastomonas sp. TaxID=1909299 RepID=UPI0035948C3E
MAFRGRALLTALIILSSCTADAPIIEEKSAARQPADCPASDFAFGAFQAIPSGSFIKGADPIYPEEQPEIRLQVTGFAIQRHEVTNAQFARFVDATGYVTSAEHAAASSAADAGSALFVPGINGAP